MRVNVAPSEGADDATMGGTGVATSSLLPAAIISPRALRTSSALSAAISRSVFTCFFCSSGSGRDEHIEHPLRKAHPADEHERETAEDEEDYAEHAEETADQQQPYGNKAEREHEQRLDHRPEQERKAALEKQRGPRLVAYADGDEPHAYDADEHAQYYHEHGCGYRPASRSAAGYREILPGADEHRAEEHEHEHRNGHGHPEIALAHAVKIALYGEVALRVDQPAQRIARARNTHRGYQRTKHDHRIEYNVGLHAELFEHAERTRIGGQRGGADVGSKGIYRDERTDVDLTQVCSAASGMKNSSVSRFIITTLPKFDLKADHVEAPPALLHGYAVIIGEFAGFERLQS